MSIAEEFVNSHIDLAIQNLFTELPGYITAIKKKENSTVVNVQLAVTSVDNTNTTHKYPELEDLIVQWPESGGCYFSTPLSLGDPVTVHFYMTNVLNWKNSDGSTVVNPARKRSHSINDAYVTVGGLPYRVGRENDPEASVMASDKVEIRVKKDGTIELGKDSVERLILGDTFRETFAKLLTPLLTHTHPVSGSTAAASIDLASALNTDFPVDPLLNANTFKEDNLSQVSKTL